MSIRGVTSKVLPYAGAAVGGFFGGPAGAEAGYTVGKTASRIVAPKQTATPATAYAQTASSIDEARGQDKSRMRRQYGM